MKRKVGIAGTEKFDFFYNGNDSKKLTFISESSKSSNVSLHLTEAIVYLIFVNFGTPLHFLSL